MYSGYHYRKTQRGEDKISRDQFEQDLARKHWAILLTDTSGTELRGFSTLRRVRTQLDGQKVTAYSSGETIIHPHYWEQLELPRVWARHVMELCSHEPGVRAYWFLITSSYSIYRFLPLFFNEFYPRRDRATPAEMKKLVDHLAKLEFGNEYDPEGGLIRFSQPAPLKPELTAVCERHLKNPDVAFFVYANPHYPQGEELACLAPISLDNFTSAALRLLGPKRALTLEPSPRVY